MNPLCPYCGKESKEVLGDEIYPGRRATEKSIYYECLPCGAYVGCHKYTDRPLGTLANYELRAIRVKTHKEFDWIWNNPKLTKMNRTAAYRWLARQLGIAPNDCHIALFTEKECNKVLGIVSGYKKHYNFGG